MKQTNIEPQLIPLRYFINQLAIFKQILLKL